MTSPHQSINYLLLDNDYRTALSVAISLDDSDTVILCLDKLSVEELSKYDYLYVSFLYDKDKILEILLTKITPTNEDLKNAALLRKYKCVDVLLRYNLDINETIEYLYKLNKEYQEDIEKWCHREYIKETESMIEYLKTKISY